MKAFLLTFLSFVIACNVHAQSPQQPLTHPNPAQETPKPEERGTEQSPIVIKVLPPLNENEKTAAEKQEREDKSDSDWWLVKLTGVLAFIGVVQIVVFGLQALRLRQTVDEMKIATKATEKAANATEQSVNLAREQFIATQRPYLYAFGVGQLQIAKITDRGTQPYLIYTMANYGNTPAVIDNLTVGITTSQSAEPDDLPLLAHDTHPVVKAPVFAAKETRELREELPEGMYFRQGSPLDFDSITIATPEMLGAKEMFFTVIVRHSGPFTKGHESQFCWRLDQMSVHFVQFGGEKYNYVK